MYKRRERRQSEAYSRSVRNKKNSDNGREGGGSFLLSHVKAGYSNSNSNSHSTSPVSKKLYRNLSRQNSTVGGMTIDKTVSSVGA